MPEGFAPASSAFAISSSSFAPEITSRGSMTFPFTFDIFSPRSSVTTVGHNPSGRSDDSGAAIASANSIRPAYSAMPPPIQAASIKAWGDEQHVRENRALYTKKFAAMLDILQPAMDIQAPTAGFYLWPYTHFDDQQFARRLYAEQNVTVLPGSYLSRTDHKGVNPGQMRVRLALVPSLEECIDAAERIREFVRGL